MNSNSRAVLVAFQTIIFTGILHFSANAYADTPAMSDDKQVVATYEGHTITLADVNHEIEVKPAYAMFLQEHPDKKKEIQANVARSMIDRALLLEVAAQSKTLDPKNIKEQVDAIVTQYGGKEKLSEMLLGMKSTFDQFTSQVADDFKIKGYLEKNLFNTVAIAPDELLQTYNANPEHYAQAAAVKASHILIRPASASPEDDKKAKDKIDDLAAQIKSGKDFAALAKENSQDGSAQQGGDLGFFQKGMMVPEFEKAAFALKTGEVSAPVKTQFGYHLIKVTEVKPAAKRSFEEAKPLIEKEMLSQKQNQVVEAKLKELREKAKVNITMQ
jgi:peptidyl-prolyl cis-trans isomerase C